MTRWLKERAARRAADRLPPPLLDLRDRLAEAFALHELMALSFRINVEVEPAEYDVATRYAQRLARAAWCRGRLAPLLEQAAQERGDAWTPPDLSDLPAPPAERCEEDPPPVLFVFSDWKQVAALLLILLAAAAAVYAAVWWSGRPARMTRDFNIAVAAVDVENLSGTDDPANVGRMLQGQVVRIVEEKLRAIDPEGEATSVSGTKMPVVRDREEARRLARQVNAQLVIYGRADLDRNDPDGLIRYAPAFYVDLDAVQADVGEMQRDVSIDAPLRFTLRELLELSPPTGRTADAATLLTHFVRALVKLAGDDLPAARGYIDAAVARTEDYVAAYEPFAGREVIYLYASQIARLQAGEETADETRRAWHREAAVDYANRALAVNPEYGRGYIARGNLAYDAGNLYQAQQDYLTAARYDDPEALVWVKSALGLGNVYLRNVQHLHETQPWPIGQPCPAEAAGSAADSLAAYSEAQAARDAATEPDPRLDGIALGAWIGAGKVHHYCGDTAAAAEAYRRALALDEAGTRHDEVCALLAALPGEEDEGCDE